MKRLLTVLVLISALTLTGCGSEDANIEVEEKKEVVSEDFISFEKGFDNLTDIQEKEKWNEVESQLVIWEGNVSEAFDNSIMLIIKDTTKDADVIAHVKAEYVEQLSKINMGDRIKIKGELYSKGTGFFPWEINNCDILE